jgi:hypothetical protein
VGGVDVELAIEDMRRRVGREDVCYNRFFVRHCVNCSAIDQFGICGEQDRVRIVIYSRHLERFMAGGVQPRDTESTS